MKILVTGAHFTPAVAVLEELKKYPNAQVIYVGRKKTLEGDRTISIESQALPSMGIKFIPITTGRLQRAFSIYTIPSLFKIPVGFIQALFIILSQKPDVILSFGGYVGVPLVITGWFLSVPVIVHEQTLVSGLANKISAWFADKIAVSFSNTVNGEKVILTGNPIREIIKKTQTKKSRGLPVILITGGNQGSHAINLAVEESLGEISKFASVIHVAGDNKYHDYERLKNL
ncbi:MAG: glycosyltransferase, partial [Candidatus Daviesbacteria bacterium]|nr:glycosyltransferase [Candidatus Daviesbacteria bacterium]